MKAGKLRHVIQLQRVTSAPDDYGTPVDTWALLATLRAELVSQDKAEQIEGAAGAVDRVALVLRTRVFAGVTLADRVMFRGKIYDLKQIDGGDWAKGAGLALHCEGMA